MKNKRHRMQFPRADSSELEQDEVFFYLIDGDRKRKFRFHDYDKIYEIPGLYEQLYYDRLKCNSPAKVAEILNEALSQSRGYFTELRVIDLGAGNGIMGEALQKYGVSRLVGVDIIPEARMAVERDRPHLYDDYYVTDLCELSDEQRDDLSSWSFNCLTTVAALGFGDLPPKAFIEAFNLLQSEAWVAFNIKETFLGMSDTSGFSQTIRALIFSEYLDLNHLERYRHRLSIDGEPLYYFAIAGRKKKDIPQGFLEEHLS